MQTGIFSELIAGERAIQRELAAERDAGERRSSLENPQTPLSYPAEWLLDIFNGGRTDSGIRVSEYTAFQASAFFACVDLISGAIANLPMNVMERVPKGERIAKRLAHDHPLFDLVYLEPNPDMSRFTFIKALVCHLLAWGNGYAEIQRDAGNQAIGLWPRNPAKTRPQFAGARLMLQPEAWRPFSVTIEPGELVYKTTDGATFDAGSDQDNIGARGERWIPAADMLHVPGLALDGRLGQSVVWLARQTIGMALALDKFAAKYFANFAKPGGILVLPAQMTTDQKEQARRSWMEAQGGENAHRVAVMPPGFEFKPMSNNPAEAQAVESRRAVRNEIAGIFHVPPHMIGDTEKATRSSTEQMGQEFVQFTIGPWLTAIKLEYKRKLFPQPAYAGVGRPPARNNFFVDFDLHELLRPDAASREKFYSTGFTTASLCPNDIREYEGLNPRQDKHGDVFYVPVNMQEADNPVVVPPGQPKPAAGAEDGDAGARAIYQRWFGDAFERALRHPKPDSRVFRRHLQAPLAAIADFYCADCAAVLGDEYRQGEPLPPGAASFVLDYLGSMAEREIGDATQEFERALRSLRIAAWREMGARHAKQEKERHIAER